jgi:hypothetical protein
MVAERLLEKNLDLRIEANCLPERLVGDGTRLTQALLNFLGNAVKFSEKGRITLRATILEETGTRLQVRFEVVDAGIGIPAGKLDRIFDAFEQADNSMTREYGGTGLGLAITRSIARLMEGEVGVTSAPGQGSTFWLTAWLDKAGPARATAAKPAPDRVRAPDTRYAGRRVLLADDEPTNRLLAVEMLHDLDGLTIDLAEDGAAAVAMASRVRYDAILMDLQMPKLNGLDATRQIRKLPGYGDTPILAMTGNVFAEDRKRCVDVGMSDFIAKPFSPRQLVETLTHWLDERNV